jgi:hypothetical protein
LPLEDGFLGTESSGELDRRIAGREWLVPEEIGLRDGRLVWRQIYFDWDKRISAKPGLLQSFIRLADAPDERILAFARRWGVLELCEHDLPLRHLVSGWAHTDAPFYARSWCDYRQSEPGGRIWEPLSAWRTWARRAAATLNVAISFYRNKLPPLEEWQSAISLGLRSPDDNEPLPPTPSKGWLRLDHRIHAWLGLTGVVPRVVRNRGVRPQITFGGTGLFGALSIQLMLAVCRTDGLAVCSSCASAFVPKRRPRHGRAYCDDCRESKKPKRDASADDRKRKLASRLFQKRISLREVALKTGFDEDYLRKLRHR